MLETNSQTSECKSRLNGPEPLLSKTQKTEFYFPSVGTRRSCQRGCCALKKRCS